MQWNGNQSMSDEKAREYYFNKRPGKTYISKTLPNKYTPAVRIVSTILDGKEGGQQFAKIKDEIVLRQTHLGRREIKATVTEDERRIQTLTIQKFSAVSGPYERTYFSFVGIEIDHLLEFIIGLRTMDLPNSEKRHLSEKDLRALVLDQGQARSLFTRNAELFRQLAQREDLERDLIAVGYRRNQLEHFEKLLDDPEFFTAERVRLGAKPEAVWQKFFERNPWIFGYGLSYQFMTGLDGKKLEAVVRGFDVSGPGKRVDALMKTRGQIGSLCFVEIKGHDRSLLDKDAYRSGAWAPTGELVGGVAQIQATVHSAVEQFGRLLTPHKAEVPTGEELFNVEPRSVLVMGRLAEFETPTGIVADKVRSFELYRRNTWRPEIITYDELLERARFIVEHSQQETGNSEIEDDMPC
jgi:hypothetical protein